MTLDDSKTFLSLRNYNCKLRKDLGMKYSIEFKTDYCSMTEKELNSLAQEFKEKFVAFYCDRCKDLSILEAILEYAERYSIDERILGELIQKDKELTSRIKNSKKTRFRTTEEW